MKEELGEHGIGQRDCGRGVKWYAQGPQYDFVCMLRSLGFLLEIMGSHGMVVNIKSAFWRDPCGCCVQDGARR